MLSRSETGSVVVEHFERWVETGPGYVAVEEKGRGEVWMRERKTRGRETERKRERVSDETNLIPLAQIKAAEKIAIRDQKARKV